MTSLDVRNNSAVMKRTEQLKRWEESETNRALAAPRPETGRRVKFSSGCVFLAACVAGDKEEVLKLLEHGADINTANVDGLTALHQACIDDNLDMVEFLVENGADINRQDNEGWTPLHATASCGFVSIARYLVENGADVAAVNSDGDLALDLAMDINQMPMIDYMQEVVKERQIDVGKARTAEETMMLEDAKKWLRSDASEIDRPHPKTGATALHVASAKGYTKVLNLLLAGRPNVDKQDNDGWTPLHAAAHWSQREAAEMLVSATADMDIENYAGQTCIDVADRKMVKFLEELRANSKRTKRRPSSQIRISDAIENHVDKTPTKIVRVEMRNENSKDHPNDDKQKVLLQKQQQNSENFTSEEDAPWRRLNSARNKTNLNDSPTKSQVLDIDIGKSTAQNSETNDVILRRTQSFENDKKPIISTSTTPSSPIPPTTTQSSTISPASTVPSTATTTQVRRSFAPPARDEESETQRKAHAKRVRETRRSTQGVTLDEIKSAEELVKKKNLGMNNNNNSSTTNNNNNNTNKTNNNSNFKLEDATSGTNTYPSNNSSIIPSAPAVIAAASLSSSVSQRRINSLSGNTGSQLSMNSVGRPASTPASVGSSITASNTSLNSNDSTTYLPFNTIKKAVAAANASLNSSTTPNYTTIVPPTITITTTTTATTTTNTNNTTTNNTPTITSTSSNNNEEKDNDKENDNRSPLATQAVIQRRRKPKRRSTGVVHLDMDDLDPERQDSANDNEDKESGGERSARSRLGSTASNISGVTTSTSDDAKTRDRAENGDGIDYKALWEAAKVEIEKLKNQVKKKDDEIVQTRATLERFANATSKNSLSENEKRERRAMERKLSEMEEELKLLQKLKTENERLRAENRALTRVVSKLTTSAQNQLSKNK